MNLYPLKFSMLINIVLRAAEITFDYWSSYSQLGWCVLLYISIGENVILKVNDQFSVLISGSEMLLEM